VVIFDLIYFGSRFFVRLAFVSINMYRDFRHVTQVVHSKDQRNMELITSETEKKNQRRGKPHEYEIRCTKLFRTLEYQINLVGRLAKYIAYLFIARTRSEWC